MQGTKVKLHVQCIRWNSPTEGFDNLLSFFVIQAPSSHKTKRRSEPKENNLLFSILNASAGIDFHPALTQFAITMQIQLPIISKHYSMSDYNT